MHCHGAKGEGFGVADEGELCDRVGEGERAEGGKVEDEVSDRAGADDEDTHGERITDRDRGLGEW
jgi:hypothetical protein